MPNPKNKFSAHIFDPDVKDADIPQRQSPAKTVATFRAPNPAPKLQEAATIREPAEPKARLDYRKTRASKEGKKYINILIDKDLQSELKPRMVTRNLTWESLVEGLLQRWLEENPGFKP